MTIKAGYKTSEFWFTLVSFIFSGLYLTGLLKENEQKEELISVVSHAVESIILISGQVWILAKYIKGRNEVKKIVETEKLVSVTPSESKENNDDSKRTSARTSRKNKSRTKAVAKKSKSVALSEAWKALQLVVASTVQIIEVIAKDLEGKDKKAIAIEYINTFYDTTFSIIDIPLVPNLLEPIIHSYVKKVLMILVSSSIDATVSIFRQTGIFLQKGKV
jgi:hypothetical protein